MSRTYVEHTCRDCKGTHKVETGVRCDAPGCAVHAEKLPYRVFFRDPWEGPVGDAHACSPACLTRVVQNEPEGYQLTIESDCAATLALLGCAREDDPSLVFDYVNWKGERATRLVRPLRVRFGTAPPWHPEPCWLLDAFDIGKSALRSFALHRMRFG